MSSTMTNSWRPLCVLSVSILVTMASRGYGRRPQDDSARYGREDRKPSDCPLDIR